MTRSGNIYKNKVLIFSPREENISTFNENEYRETNVNTYEDSLKKGSLYGTDYTAFREYLGIGSISSILRKNGYDVKILIGIGLTDEEIFNEIIAFCPDYFLVSIIYDLQLLNAMMMIWKTNEKLNAISIVGGALVSLCAETLVGKFREIDFAIRGEGEIAILELLESLRLEEDYRLINNLVYVNHNNECVSNTIKVCNDLDMLPFANRDVLQKLKESNLPIKSAYLYTSRGCHGTCTFCSVPKMNSGQATKWRGRSVVNIVDEIQYLHCEYRVSFFYLTDDNFMGDDSELGNERLKSLAREIIRRGLKIQFHAECRVSPINEELLILLKKAGLSQLLFGIESGSNKTLRRWGKCQTVAQNEYAINIGRKLGFDVIPSMILLDWESSYEELIETVEFIERNKIYDIQYPLSLVNKLHILRGTSAAKRYDLINGTRKDFPVKSLDDLRNWVYHNMYYDVEIKDYRVKFFWDILLAVSNYWSYISEEVIPREMMIIRKNKHSGAPGHDFMRSARRWRNDLGVNLMKLMRSILQTINENINVEDLDRGIFENTYKIGVLIINEYFDTGAIFAKHKENINNAPNFDPKVLLK